MHDQLTIVHVQAIFQGVPMVCLTLWGDQMSNAQRMQYRGFGINLGRFATVKTNTLANSIREVGFNRKYADNIRRASTIFKSRPMNGRQRAVWWIEHVIQYGGDHLRSHAVDMVWYEYLLLDVITVFVLVPLVIITSGATILVCWLCVHRNSASKNATFTKKRQ
jgi:UDP-glucoronosyl and UDP-glucosyl transferase